MVMKPYLLLMFSFALFYTSLEGCVMPSEIPNSMQGGVLTQRLWDEFRHEQHRQIEARGGCLNSTSRGNCDLESRKMVEVPGACLFPLYRPTCFAVGTTARGRRVVKQYENHPACMSIQENTSRVEPEQRVGVLTDEEIHELIQEAKATANHTRPPPCSFKVEMITQESGECLLVRFSAFHYSIYGCRSLKNRTKFNLFDRECKHLRNMKRHRGH